MITSKVVKNIVYNFGIDHCYIRFVLYPIHVVAIHAITNNYCSEKL